MDTITQYFCISFNFLSSTYHGLKDEGENEWPPSPLRVFQALVNAASLSNGFDELASALKWLERQNAPTIMAPPPVTTPEKALGYCISVPNNSMDVVAQAWCRGNYSNSGDANPAFHRTMKTVRPILLERMATLHYLWSLNEPINEEIQDYIFKLSEISRKVVVLGWGVDMVVGTGHILSEEQANEISGEKWFAFRSSERDGLRIPILGTLDALIGRHEEFLNRLSSGVFAPPSSLTKFNKTEYLRATDQQARPIAAFSLLKTDGSSYISFDAESAMRVSGMMRHAAGIAANNEGWSKTDINKFILGHGESRDELEHIPAGPERLAYLPLPSIEKRGDNKRVVGRIRRAMITSFGINSKPKIIWASRALCGQELINKDNKDSVAFLAPIPANEKMIGNYIKKSISWSTVTPVILPGYDDPAHYRRRLKNNISADEQKHLLIRLESRIDGLLRKAIIQAGFSKVLSDNAIIEWRKVGFWAGTEFADKYHVPQHLRHLPRYHVRLQWCDANKVPLEICGPICIGGGRFYGLGLFAAEGD